MTKNNILYSLKFSALFLAVFLLSLPVFSTGLYGQNKEYAGKTLIFNTFTDPVTLESKPVFTIQFDAQGNFKTSAPVTKNTFAFSDFGIYRGMMFLEPNKDMELLLPPLREKSFADEKNPYFEPIEFWFATGNTTVNTNIAAFEGKLNELTTRFFNRLYFRQSREVYDSLVSLINAEFTGKLSETFDWHKTLSLKSIETEAFRLKPGQVADVIAKVPADMWTYPAFVELFDKVFANRLSFEIKSTGGAQLQKAIASADTGFLLDYIHKNYRLTGDVSALAAIKLLHDGFYSGDFQQEAILKMLNSDLLTKHSSSRISEIAQNTTEKLKFLMPGTKAPVICLENIDGNKVCTNEFKDKFKYLIFADTEMVVCQEQLKYLAEIQKKFAEHLQIIVVLKKTDLIEMKMFLDKAEVPGVKLVDTNGEFIDKYNVKSFPEAVLINENHEVVFQHTRTPLDGFEIQFGSYLQQQLFERQRNQAR